MRPSLAMCTPGEKGRLAPGQSALPVCWYLSSPEDILFAKEPGNSVYSPSYSCSCILKGTFEKAELFIPRYECLINDTVAPQHMQLQQMGASLLCQLVKVSRKCNDIWLHPGTPQALRYFIYALYSFVSGAIPSYC